jgi:putative DNA primase/helicase
MGDVVIVSPEDDTHETLKPRLLAAGAREDRIHVRSGSHSSIGLEAILEQADALPDVRLLIIDPISACLAGKDLNRARDVREILMGLAAWAEVRSAAVVVVTHLNKTVRGGAPLSRILGSQVFGAVARSVYLISSNPADATQRLFLPMKDNIGSIRQGLMFRIEEVILPDGILSARVVFCDGPANLTAAEALTALQAAPGKTSVLDETKAFLRDFLEAGAQSVGAVTAAAEAHGFSMASLRRACVALGIKPRKIGMNDGWVWALPELR